MGNKGFIHFFRHAMKLSIKKIGYGKQSFLLFLTTRNEAAYWKLGYCNQSFFSISLDTKWSCLLKIGLWKTKLLSISQDKQWSCLSKISDAWSKWSCYTQTVLDFTLAVNCQTEAKENAYMKMKLGSRGWAWNTNMDVVSLLNGRNATTLTRCESFLQAFFPQSFHFLFFVIS